MRFTPLLLLAACLGADQDWGTVYDCGGEVEYCYHDDAAEELSALVSRSCKSAGLGDREWPAITNLLSHGCIYCCAATCPRGANAHNGSYCP